MYFDQDPDTWLKYEYWSSLALRHTPGLGLLSINRLLQEFGSAYAAVQGVDQWSDLLFMRKHLIRNFRDELWREQAGQEWVNCRKLGLDIILYSGRDYPQRLREVPDAPVFLYYKGKPSLLHQPCLAVVGSRNCTRRGGRLAYHLAKELTKAGLCVVSGLAQGIDSQAHWGSLQGSGSSIAVLGTGLDQVYPVENRELKYRLEKKGLVLSEFEPGTQPDAHNFPRRNRIISALSLGVLVVEAASRSGSLITAGIALEQGREVFAVPGFPDSELSTGCNDLLKQGAALVRDAQDVIQEIVPLLSTEWNEVVQDVPDAKQAGEGSRNVESVLNSEQLSLLDDEEKKLLKILENKNQAHIDFLAAELGWESQKMSRVLMMLEIKGVVKQMSGMYYSLC